MDALLKRSPLPLSHGFTMGFRFDLWLHWLWPSMMKYLHLITLMMKYFQMIKLMTKYFQMITLMMTMMMAHMIVMMTRHWWWWWWQRWQGRWWWWWWWRWWWWWWWWRWCDSALHTPRRVMAPGPLCVRVRGLVA